MQSFMIKHMGAGTRTNKENKVWRAFVRCGHLNDDSSQSTAERTKGFAGRGRFVPKGPEFGPCFIRKKISSRTDHTGDRGGFQVKSPAQFPRRWPQTGEVQWAPAIKQANIGAYVAGTD